MFDAAVLDPSMTRDDAAAAIKTCVEMAAYCACVRPCDLELAQEFCRGSETKVCVVLAFPHGQQLSVSKADEARRYVEMGVDEVDMVANYGWVKSGLWNDVKADIAAVVAVTRPAEVPLKVIFETAQLEAEEIKQLVDICIEAGADFVKTSTGFNGEGAQEQDVKRMIEAAAGRIKVKPSGGIRDLERARMFVDMGAHRLGLNAASAKAICDGQRPAFGGMY